MAVHQGKRKRQLNLGQSTGQDKWLLEAIFLTCMHILYLKREGAILVTPHMSLPISTTTAGELLRSLTLHNDIKSITVSG